MMRKGRLVLTCAWIALLSIASCEGDEPVRTSAELTAALVNAESGDLITLAEGRFEGRFVVPAGVIVSGAGRGLSEIVGPSDSEALVLTPGSLETPTAIESMTVTGGGAGAWVVLANGSGHARVTRVDVVVPGGGAGIGAEGLDAFTVDQVTVTGPVTRENAGGLPPEPDVALTAADGIALVSVGSATMTDVGVRGFGSFGVESIESDLSWSGESYVRDTLGTGLMVFGGSADLDGVELTGALAGISLIPAFNAVFAGGASITTNALVVDASEGYGILQTEAHAEHTGLSASGNELAGLWIQSCEGSVVDGGTFADNGLAGIAIFDSVDVRVRDTTIRGTQFRTRTIGSTPVDVADGLLAVNSNDGLDLEALELDENERVGALFDLGGGTMDGTSLATVVVTGSADMLGAVAQNGTAPPGWDEPITRQGATVDNDAGFSGTLAIVEVVTPSDLPLDSVAITSGVEGVVTPSD